jgi:cobalamin synthase
VGILVGAISGGIYWLAAQFWPSSVAVVLSLSATAVLGGSMSEDSFAKFPPRWIDVFVLLITYNALMALTAANVGFSVPANLALGLIMICGQAASRGLVVSVLAARPRLSPRMTSADLGVALLLGFAPAALLGIPGMMGLVASILMRLGLAPYVNREQSPPALLNTVQPLTEACFYLGALATWKYI